MLKIIVIRTDKLCLTTLVSLSNSKTGCHKFINIPPNAVINMKMLGTINMVKNCNILNFKNIVNIKDDNIIQGSKMDICTKALDKNKFFSFIGVLFKSQIFLPSNEIELADIGAVEIIKQKIITKAQAIKDLEIFIFKYLIMPSKPMLQANMLIAIIIMAPMIVLIKYAGQDA